MDLKKAIAALPWLRRAWRILPGPLRLPLLVVGAVYWLWKKFRGQEEEIESEPSPDQAA
ncbi:MAG: hypothetical protein R3320_09175 [Nitriliruptorales bacterium]|nr:hypothetical protein [Nitriliruptorales bacterium]